MLSGGLLYASRGVVREKLYKECANASSPLHKGDALYAAANPTLCSFACPCEADPSLWRNYASQQSSSVAAPTSNQTATNPFGAGTNTGMNTATTGTNVAQSATMVTIEGGAQNF